MGDRTERNNEDVEFKETVFGKKMREWAFWFIVAFLAGLTVKDVANLIKDYCGNPKKSDMNVRFNETMQMPNITFCMSRAQAWSHFRLNDTVSGKQWEDTILRQLKNMTDAETFLKQPWEYEMVMETYNLIATLTSMERETTAHGTVNSIQKFRTQERLAEIRKLSKFWLNELDKREVKFEDFVQKVGKETLRRSMQRFQRTTYDEDLVIKTQLSITWISQIQLCFQATFDDENLKPIDEQGQFFVMVLSHNAENLKGQQVECMTADFHGRPSSSSRFMGNKGIIKDGFTDELCVGMMHETTVEVKARYKMLENDAEGTACHDHESGEDNEWDCYLRCRMEFIRDVCQCTAPTLSYLVKENEDMELKKWPLCNYAECEADVQGRNYSDEDCAKKCHRSCDQIRFNIDHERKGKSARPDFTTVVLNWGSFEYLTLEQDWVWSPTTFIAAIGGSIGMWLGLSILSLIQGSTYMYTYVTEEVIKKRKNRNLSIEQVPKMSKAHEELHEDKLAANPFASPFKKPSNAQSVHAEN